MRDIYIIKRVLGSAYSLLKNISSRILRRGGSKKFEIKEFYYFKNINECVKFIDINNYELTKYRNIKLLSINVHFENSDKEIEVKNLGVIEKPFVKIEKKLDKNIIKLSTRYIPVKIKFIRLLILFRTSPT